MNDLIHFFLYIGCFLGGLASGWYMRKPLDVEKILRMMKKLQKEYESHEN